MEAAIHNQAKGTMAEMAVIADLGSNAVSVQNVDVHLNGANGKKGVTHSIEKQVAAILAHDANPSGIVAVFQMEHRTHIIRIASKTINGVWIDETGMNTTVERVLRGIQPDFILVHTVDTWFPEQWDTY